MKVRKLISVLNTDTRVQIIQHKETGYETLFSINFPVFLDSTLLNMKILDFTPMVHYWTQRESESYIVILVEGIYKESDKK